MKNHISYLHLCFAILFIGLLGSCSGKETGTDQSSSSSSTKKIQKTAFWDKKNPNPQIDVLLKKAQNALKQNKLKPNHLSDTTDVRKFLEDHKTYQDKIQIDTVQVKRRGEDNQSYYQQEFIGTIYVSPEIELALSSNTWGIIFKSTTKGSPNEIFIFTKSGWGVYALSGRSDTGIWKNDVYYLDLNGQVSESKTKSKNIEVRANKYLKEHVNILRKRKKRPEK